MKTITVISRLFLLVILVSCSKDDDALPSSKLNHVGEKWIITSVEYTIIDQSLSDPSQWFKTGTTSDAGYFYFNGSEGSFNILIDRSRQEDYFGYTEDESDITIVNIDQSLSGTKFSQNVIAMSGDKTTTTMNLSGTFTKQNITQQYVFTGTFVLTKE